MHISCVFTSLLLQDKKAPKKAQGTKQPVADKGQAQAQQTDLIEDAQLPPSKKSMPVWPADRTFCSCLPTFCSLPVLMLFSEKMQCVRAEASVDMQPSTPQDRNDACYYSVGCKLQAGVPVRVHKPKVKSARWPRAWPASMDLPDDCCPGDLVEVLETLQACHLTLTLPLWHLKMLRGSRQDFKSTF